MIWTYASAGAVAVAIAATGGLMTDVKGWYENLRKPSWQPPNWLFGPAWTLIFALSAFAGARAWAGAPNEITRLVVTGLFLLNGVLNVLWSYLFFKIRRPDLALIEVGPLWLSILSLILAVAPITESGAWALSPYLAWVSFAAYLNYTIFRLNRPFPPMRAAL